MAATELWQSRSIVENTQAVTGVRIFKAPAATWRIDCPGIGAYYPGHPLLRLKERVMEPLTPDKSGGGGSAEWVKVTCNYSTMQFLDDAPQESGEFSGEVLETTLGESGRPRAAGPHRRWASSSR